MIENTDLRASAKRLQTFLEKYHVDTKVVEFQQTTRTSKEAADTIGCEIGQIAKTLIFKGKNSAKPICVIASGKNKVDEKKIALFIGEEIEKPDAQYVATHTTFTIGGVPPIGYPLDIKPMIDEDLLTYPQIWAAAGTPFAVFCLTPQDLIHITQGHVLNLRK